MQQSCKHMSFCPQMWFLLTIAFVVSQLLNFEGKIRKAKKKKSLHVHISAKNIFP